MTAGDEQQSGGGGGQGSGGGWRSELARYRAGREGGDHAAAPTGPATTDDAAVEPGSPVDGDDAPHEPPGADGPDTTAEAPEETSSPVRRPTGTILAAVLALLFAALAILMTFVAVSLRSDLEDERDRTAGADADRAQVADVAGQFSAALLSYDHEDLETTRQRVLRLSTGRFQDEYERAFEGLAELITSTRSTATATVSDVFVGDVDGGDAEVITVVDASVEGTAGRRDVADSYIRLNLVKVEGVWRVDGVTNLNFTASAPAVTVPGATSSTTTP